MNRPLSLFKIFVDAICVQKYVCSTVLEPNYLHIVLTFPYKGWQLQVDEQEEDGRLIYSVWAHHPWGCDVAVPLAFSRIEAIRKAKQWIDRKSLPPKN